MANEESSASALVLDIRRLLADLEVPFPPDKVRWRVTNTTIDKKRGQIVPYADPRAYTDRLNALFSPQGWTREYKIEAVNNITRMKKGESIVSGKVLVTCTVTIIGLWSHCGTGEDWADDDNGMTSADAQAFKRACSCFGLGRYFYDFPVFWVDLDQNRQPVRAPVLSGWALPEILIKRRRPPRKNGDGKAGAGSQGAGSNGGSAGNKGQATARPTGPANGNGRSGQGATGKANGSATSAHGEDLDERILRLGEAVGASFYRNILREYGRVNQPKLIRDAAVKRKVLQVLESAVRGFDRLRAVTQRLDPTTVETQLTKLQAPPIAKIADMKTLQDVVFGLEGLGNPNCHHAA